MKDIQKKIPLTENINFGDHMTDITISPYHPCGEMDRIIHATKPPMGEMTLNSLPLESSLLFQ